MRKTVFVILALVFLGGCGKKAEEGAPAVETEVTRTDKELLMSASLRLIDSFSRQLKSELMAAINEGGPEKAIEICRVRAAQIASDHSNDFWSIRRVSDRNRNPGNLASPEEVVILARFADSTIGPPEFTFEWTDADSGKVYRYYRPITVAPLCLKCHGGPEDISDGAKAVLSSTYPDDKATGYRSGELRGMLVVEAKWPEGKQFAEALVRGNL